MAVAVAGVVGQGGRVGDVFDGAELTRVHLHNHTALLHIKLAYLAPTSKGGFAMDKYRHHAHETDTAQRTWYAMRIIRMQDTTQQPHIAAALFTHAHIIRMYI